MRCQAPVRTRRVDRPARWDAVSRVLDIGGFGTNMNPVERHAAAGTVSAAADMGLRYVQFDYPLDSGDRGTGLS